MKPNNSNDANEHKIVVQKRGTLPVDETSDADKVSKEVVSEVENKEERRLESHKVRLEPDETGAITAVDDAPKQEEKDADKPRQAEEKTNTPLSDKPQALKNQGSKISHNPTPEEQARLEKVSNLIAERKYFVPISHNKKSRSTTQFVVTFVVVLLVGLLAIDLVIDAGLVKN